MDLKSTGLNGTFSKYTLKSTGKNGLPKYNLLFPNYLIGRPNILFADSFCHHNKLKYDWHKQLIPES